MKLSEALYQKRCTSGKTQNDASALIGISVPTYNFLENGKYPFKTIKPITVGRLCRYLGCEPKEIIEMFKEEKQ